MYFWMNVIMRWKQLISRIFSCFKCLKSFYKLQYSEMCIQFIISYDNEKGNEMMEDPTWITLPYWITEPINLEVSDSFCRRSTSAACWNNEFFKLIAIYISKVINDTSAPKLFEYILVIQTQKFMKLKIKSLLLFTLTSRFVSPF